MIPRSAVRVTSDANLEKVAPPGADTVAYPHWLGIVHEHSAWIWAAASWEEAGVLLALEREALADRDRRASDAGEFEELLDELWEDDRLIASGCDFGVGAAVWALNAAGIVTASSCSGHVEGGPTIFVASDRRRAELLLTIARRAECGLEDVNSGLMLWAPSIAEMLELASQLMATRDAFDALPLPVEREVASDEDVGYD